MDFLKLLKSLEEFLYEVIIWLVFFPRTLWRVLVRPRAMAAYVNRELAEKTEGQFNDALSPPLFLMLSVLSAHGLELAMHQTVLNQSGLAKQILGSEQGLLLYRSIAFATWPLIAAVHFLARSRTPLNRDSLRRPFFAHCFLAGPFVILFSAANLLLRAGSEEWKLVGLVALMVSLVWYLTVQAGWLRDQLPISRTQATLSAVLVVVAGGFMNFAVGTLISME